MVKNFIITAWRNIQKNKGFSVLNIVSLSLGIACCLLLCAYIIHEWSYDRFYKKIDRLAYVSFEYKSAGDAEFNYIGSTPSAVAPTLKQEFAEVENAVRLYEYNGDAVVKMDDLIITESKLLCADEDFFDILSYDFVEGTPDHAIAAPYQMVITTSLAKKYFPNKPALHETLLIDGQPWKITGVVQDPPTYTRYGFHAVMSNKHLTRYQELEWHSANDVTILCLKSPNDFQKLQEKVDVFIEKQFAEMLGSGAQLKVNIEKLADVHLHSKAGSGNLMYIYIFAALAIALIVLACVNFTNLVLARSAERAKEVGVKKVLGAARTSIFFQFLLECILMIAIAIIIGLTLASLILPAFSQYIGVPMKIDIWSNPWFYIGLLGFSFVISILAGGWPALAISALQPILTIKGKLHKPQQKFTTGKALVVVQFCISILFIICTLLAGRQLNYLQTIDTGLNRSQIVVLNGRVLSEVDRNTLKDKLTQLAFVNGVTASYDSPINVMGGYNINYVEGRSSELQLSVTAIPVEKDFLSVFEIPIVAGNDLSDNDILRVRNASDNPEYSFIINKMTATAINMTPEEAIGKTIHLNGRIGKIKTVVDNFNFASLKEEVKPIVIFPEYSYFGNVFVKIDKQANMTSSLASIEDVWKQIKPDIAFESHFLDDDYAALYKHEQQTAKIMRLFSIITIGIACIGLFALSAYATQQRIKEIGIRKVLGASVSKIVGLLTLDFIKLVVIALFIATPVASLMMNKWLEEFAYRINIEWWVFMLAGLMTVLISFLTLSFQAVKAALANPVDSLRDE